MSDYSVLLCSNIRTLGCRVPGSLVVVRSLLQSHFKISPCSLICISELQVAAQLVRSLGLTEASLLPGSHTVCVVLLCDGSGSSKSLHDCFRITYELVNTSRHRHSWCFVIGVFAKPYVALNRLAPELLFFNFSTLCI